MRNSRCSWSHIGKRSTLHAVSAGLGAGITAAIRGGDVKASSSIVGAGTGLLSASMGTAIKFGFFGEPPKGTTPPPSMHIIGPAFLNLVGASIGYFGAKLFINATVSAEPLVDATIGVPITAGLLFCSHLLLNYYDQKQNVQNANFKRHTP